MCMHSLLDLQRSSLQRAVQERVCVCVCVFSRGGDGLVSKTDVFEGNPEEQLHFFRVTQSTLHSCSSECAEDLLRALPQVVGNLSLNG